MWQAVRDREEKLVGRQVENGIKNEFSLQCARVYVCECVCVDLSVHMGGFIA